jgi:hypothetical protein
MDEKIVKELLEAFYGKISRKILWKDFKKDYINRQKELEQVEKSNKTNCHLKSIGKCYKFHNSYGHGEKWWLYIKIVGIEKDGDWIIHKFQKDNYGRIEIESETTWSDFDEDSDYIPISEKEYKKAIGLILQEITDVS